MHLQYLAINSRIQVLKGYYNLFYENGFWHVPPREIRSRRMSRKERHIDGRGTKKVGHIDPVNVECSSSPSRGTAAAVIIISTTVRAAAAGSIIPPSSTEKRAVCLLSTRSRSTKVARSPSRRIAKGRIGPAAAIVPIPCRLVANQFISPLNRLEGLLASLPLRFRPIDILIGMITEAQLPILPSDFRLIRGSWYAQNIVRVETSCCS
mmetsp:Transcript_12631/g.26113  ORF Transcript_12631/g.26113 Transcript_12631/m.26113 type:complete len:208 (-) Transcript_12631:27-650(-)